MSGRTPTELLVAVHHDDPRKKSIRISIDGEDKRGAWIGRELIESFHHTGQTTKGTDRNGQKVVLALAHITIPEWLAIKEGLV